MAATRKSIHATLNGPEVSRLPRKTIAHGAAARPVAPAPSPTGSTLHHGRTIVSIDGHDVIECAVCGFCHSDPLVSDEDLKKFYGGTFYEECSEYFRYAEEDKEWAMLRYGYYFEKLESLTEGRRLLDIGSGPGYFLEAARERGWQVLGFEPSTIAAQYTSARGIPVINDFYSAGKAQDLGKFDVISLNLVLEHLRDPISLIDDAKRILAPGGLLFVTVPNDFNPLQMQLWQDHGFAPWWVVPKHHLNYFNPGSLKRLFASRNMETVHQETSYPMELFLLEGRNYVGNFPLGRECHKQRKAFEIALLRSNLPLMHAVSRTWSEQSIGRECIIIGRNPASSCPP